MLYDFIEYWASSRLLLAGKNPYSLTDLHALQQSVGWTQLTPHIMWNPPWTLAFLLPFGSLDFQVARFLWIVSLSAMVLFSARHLWTLYGGAKSRYWVAWIVTLSFAPTIFQLLLQQIGLLTLLGLVGFLHFEKQKYISWTVIGSRDCKTAPLLSVLDNFSTVVITIAPLGNLRGIGSRHFSNLWNFYGSEL